MATEFAGGDHAALYVKYRPKASPQVINNVLEYLKERIPTPFASAVDVACGSGQSTQILGGHFKTVLGTDVSEAQVKEAMKANTATNIKYSVADAEHIPTADGSVDLVTCSQAAHWLDFPAFCREVDRILKPSGCLAVYARDPRKLLHQNEKVAEKLNELFLGFRYDTLKGYWGFAAEKHGELYTTLQIPYPEFEKHVLHEYNDEPLSHIIGQLSSLSAYQNFCKEHPDDDILTALQDKILETLQVDTSPGDTIIKSVCPIYLLLGRKPQERSP